MMKSSNAVAPGEERVLVAVRMRPLNSSEQSTQNNPFWRVLKENKSICAFGVPPFKLIRNRNFFSFDKTFDELSTTGEVYDQTSRDIVQGVMNGLNGTIVAYGQSSSGKTFTMQGSGTLQEGAASGGGSSALDNGGIVHMVASDIFHRIETEPERVFSVRVSFIEIYNEEVRDLLVSGDSVNNAILKIREDQDRGVFVDSNETTVTSRDNLLSGLFAGEKNRSFATTQMNKKSSRSHAIVRVTVASWLKVKQKNGDDSDEEDLLRGNDTRKNRTVRVSTLNLVDLAGAESVRDTGATGERKKEGDCINKSLLAFTLVIKRLGQNAPHVKNAPHVNFRDSVLTRILQPSLSGNARVAIICCATPSHFEATRLTLQFASEAKRVKTRAQVGEISDNESRIEKPNATFAASREVTSSTKSRLSAKLDDLPNAKSESNEGRTSEQKWKKCIEARLEYLEWNEVTAKYELASARSEIDDANRRIERLTAENNAARDDNNAKLEQISVFESKNSIERADMRNQLREKDEAYLAVRRELNANKVERDELDARLSDASSAVEEAKAKAADQKLKVQCLSEEVRTAHAKNEEYESMLEEMTEELKVTNAKATAEQATTKKAEEDLKASKTKVVSLTARIEKLKKMMLEMQSGLTDAKANEDKAKASEESLQRTITDLKEKLEAVNATAVSSSSAATLTETPQRASSDTAEKSQANTDVEMATAPFESAAKSGEEVEKVETPSQAASSTADPSTEASGSKVGECDDANDDDDANGNSFNAEETSSMCDAPVAEKSVKSRLARDDDANLQAPIGILDGENTTSQQLSSPPQVRTDHHLDSAQTTIATLEAKPRAKERPLDKRGGKSTADVALERRAGGEIGGRRGKDKRKATNLPESNDVTRCPRKRNKNSSAAIAVDDRVDRNTNKNVENDNEHASIRCPRKNGSNVKSDLTDWSNSNSDVSSVEIHRNGGYTSDTEEEEKGRPIDEIHRDICVQSRSSSSTLPPSSTTSRSNFDFSLVNDANLTRHSGELSFSSPSASSNDGSLSRVGNLNDTSDIDLSLVAVFESGISHEGIHITESYKDFEAAQSAMKCGQKERIKSTVTETCYVYVEGIPSGWNEDQVKTACGELDMDPLHVQMGPRKRTAIITFGNICVEAATHTLSDNVHWEGCWIKGKKSSVLPTGCMKNGDKAKLRKEIKNQKKSRSKHR